MKMKSWLTAGALALTLHSGAALAAVTLWNNGGPGAVDVGGSNLTSFVQAQDFNIGFTSNLTGIRFWSLEATPNDFSGQIGYRILSDAGGTPGATVLDSGLVSPTRIAAGSVLGLNQFQNDFAINVAGLTAGTYWVELHNGPLGNNSDLTQYYWSWADIGGANAATTRGQEDDLLVAGVSWLTNDAEHAFAVFGDRVPDPNPTPVPGTLALAFLALGLIARSRRYSA